MGEHYGHAGETGWGGRAPVHLVENEPADPAGELIELVRDVLAEIRALNVTIAGLDAEVRRALPFRFGRRN